jgi:antitoxin (DNA-binding transcriptional repressor) of toxin-antitoxin stability system
MYSLYMTALHFDTVSDARAHLTQLLDAAEAGQPASLRRGLRRTAVVDSDRLRATLAALRPANAEVFAEAGGWVVTLPNTSLAADASTLEDAIVEMIQGLREYAEDWADHLLHAPNHRDNWGLVQLIQLSDDVQLHAWLVGE